MKNDITIVTAFFDIGRGEWNKENGYLKSFERKNEVYFEYFARLAKLDNDMVIFTSSDLIGDILEMRKGKITKFVILDLHKKFRCLIGKISTIQDSSHFKKLIPAELLSHPEYWSAEYVLINNLKPYFMKKAIDMNLVSSELVAWIDFGYVRSNKTLYGITNWKHEFDKNKIHFFSICNNLDFNDKRAVQKRVLNNEPYIIGGVLVASKATINKFCKIVFETQRNFLSQNIIDDDQGVFLTCVSYYPDNFKLNYLGHSRWFRVFRLFHKGSKFNNFIRLCILLRIIK